MNSAPFIYRNPRIAAHAAGQACANCEGRGTVSARHSPLQEHGRSNHHAPHDIFVAFLCEQCCAFLDACGERRDPTGQWASNYAGKREMFLRAMFKTQLILLHDEVLK